MSIYIIGMGMGTPGTLTSDAQRALAEADMLIGAARLINALPAQYKGARTISVRIDELAELIKSNGGRSICVLMSGDTGFYSGTQSLLNKIGSDGVVVLPGVSSVQFFASRLCRPWQNWKLVSAHGKTVDAVRIVCENAEAFFLTGGELTVSAICAQLTAAGFGGLTVSAGEKLGSDEQRVMTDTAAALAAADFDDLSVLLVDNPSPRRLASCGFPDSEFIRGGTPMTKSAVRSVILSRLNLHDTDIVYDVGAGTGSVSVEAALLARGGHVYAFECEEEGCRLIEKNAWRFGVSNISVISSEAPKSFAGLPAPDTVFIGGSNGALVDIVSAVLQKNKAARLVISAVTLETLSQASALMARLPVGDVEILQLSVSQAKPVGTYHLMTAHNPIFILSATGTPETANERG